MTISPFSNLLPCNSYEFCLPHPRSALMGRPPTAQTCWPTEDAWPCWWWASSWSPLCWSWRWLRTAAWLGTFSWACASSRTAALYTRTCRPPGTVAWAPAAAAAETEPTGVGRGRFGCEMKFGEKRAGEHWLSMKGIQLQYRRWGGGLYDQEK